MADAKKSQGSDKTGLEENHISRIPMGKESILFLTNNENTKETYQWLCAHEKERQVVRISERLTFAQIKEWNPFFMVSFNYRFIIQKEVIEFMQGKIINLHSSYLPFNRGASPNFFSFIEGTKKGVTIHQIDAGIDTGDILVQKELMLDPKTETFQTAYDKLVRALSLLFQENWEAIKNGELLPKKQTGAGTCHTKKDLLAWKEKYPFRWEDNIASYLERIK